MNCVVGERYTRTSGVTIGENIYVCTATNTWTQLAPATKQVGFIIGADTGDALADTADQAGIYVNRLGRSITITEVWCQSDGGTPTIQLQKDDGSVTDMLSSNLSCSTSGATTTTFVSGENVVANTDKINYLTKTAGGTAKRITVFIKFTLN
jgi:hypothetical protein